MKKIGRGTPRPKPQFLKQGLTIYHIENKTKEEVAAIIRNRVADFERTHEGYKFDRLIQDAEDPSPHMNFELKFIYEIH